jgi:hypothetical protein
MDGFSMQMDGLPYEIGIGRIEHNGTLSVIGIKCKDLDPSIYEEHLNFEFAPQIYATACATYTTTILISLMITATN